MAKIIYLRYGEHYEYALEHTMSLSMTKKTAIFLQLIRIESLVAVALVMGTFRYAVLGLTLKVHGYSLFVSLVDFLLLVFCVLFTLAAAAIINDYFDVRSDRINKPSRVIVGRFVSRVEAILWHSFFNILAVGLGVVFCLRQGLFLWIFSPFLVTALLWVYSFSLKRKLLIGNILLALLAASLPILVIYPDLYLLQQYIPESVEVIRKVWFNVLLYAVFCFVLFFCGGVLKNLMNEKGNLSMGYHTEPVAWGVRRTRYLLTVVLVLLQIFVPLYIVFFIPLPDISFLISLGIVVFEGLATLALFYLFKGEYRAAYRVVLFTLLAGILCVWIIYCYLLYGCGFSF